ncbi:hypothetical protein [Pseudothioclava nitratireducens]|jgi:hypothetical protein|uniref:hypothetical protein n=1 Tax=Pseudothioclava nitratireducens TaxID=1928646 RepID=UPI0023DB6773|nr:hypothetical protein [Defluviimonas nitratireducens]MDF1621359.1 hypothetical protein [Defluviimonas nitratireducens]
MFKQSMLAACAALGLSGCEVPVMIAAEANDGKWLTKGRSVFEIEFPAVMIVQVERVGEEVLTGTLLGHANGTARYALTGPNWGACEGAYDKTGMSTFSCANGLGFSVNLGEQRAKMSGHHIVSGAHRGRNFVSILGWGNEASEPLLRGYLKGRAG